MYLRIQFSVICILMLGLAIFNYVVDPYGVYLPQSSYSFNRNKTEFFMKEPLIKPYRVIDMKPDTVILGMSQAGLGYDENHAAFSGKSMYNFSMAGVSMYMVYRAFQHAMMESDLRHVFLDLSVLSFNEYDANVVGNENNAVIAPFENLIAVKADGSRSWLAMFRRITQIPRFLLSYQATRDSIFTMKNQDVAVSWVLNSHGGWRGSTLPAGASQGKRFLQVERYLINGYFRNASPTHPFSIYRKDGSLSRAFDYYERLLGEAHRNNIEVTLVLSPNHIYFYEALDYLGLGEMFADWKRSVVLINERVSGRYGKSSFPIWDFAYYSPITTEPVPAIQNKSARMKWFYDPLHFTRATGDHVLDQALLSSDGTGLKMTADNVDAVMEMQHQEKQKFHRENKEQIKLLKAMFNTASGIEVP